MRRRLSPLLLGALLLLPAPGVLAAEGPLRFDEALRLTRERAFAIQATRQRLAVLQAQRQVTAAAQGPTVGIGAGANYRGLFNGLPQQNLDNTTFPLLQAQGPGIDTTLTASQLLFDHSATANGVANASDQVAIGELAVQTAEQQALETTALAYVELLQAESLQAVAADGVTQARAHLRFGEARLKAGAGTRADVLQLQARLAQSQDAWLQAQNAVALARLTLGNAMNRPLEAGQAVVAVDRPLRPPLADGDLPAGLARRPEVRSQHLRLTVATRQVAIEEAAFWPTVNASGRATQRNLQQAGVQAGLDLAWPVYDGARAGQRREAARHALEAERVQLALVQQAAELEIRQAELRRREARSRQGAVAEAVTAAAEAYRIVVRRFELGLATVVEVADAQTILLRARQDRIRAATDLVAADVRLRRALGEALF